MNLIERTGKRIFKINIFLIILLASFSVAQAQVKVGDNPNVINANAVLDVESTNKGLLLPRVALTGTTNVAPLTAHVAGMAVYNTATVADVTPGYYFNDGTKWVAIADAAEADMQLGTHDQTLTANRAVTLGNLDLNFDANTLMIDGSANRVGVGTATPGRLFHVAGNARINTNELLDGFLALGNINTSNQNTGIAFYSDTDASEDAGIYRQSGVDGNLVIDNEGNGVSYLVNRGSGDIRLGTNSSNDLYIVNGGNVGIGTGAPIQRLDVNGTVRLNTGLVSSSSTVRMSTGDNSNGWFQFEGNNAANGNDILDFKLNPTNAVISTRASQALVLNDNGGNVGIGTSAPVRKLDVFGSMVIGNDSDDNTLTFRRANGGMNGAIGYATGSNGIFEFTNSSGGGTFTFDTNTSLFTAPAFTILNNGSTVTAGGAVINEQSLDQDFRVESDGNANMLVVNAGTNRVGIGTNAPNAALDVPGGAHLSTTRIEGNSINLAQDATGDRNSILRFYSDADGSYEAAITRRSGVNGTLIIDNEGNGITYLRNRGSGEIRLGTNNSDDLRILNGGQIRLANLPVAGDSDLPVQATANGDLRKGYRAGEIIKTTIRKTFTKTVLLNGDQVDIGTQYTPVMSNSTILVTYDCDYLMGGHGTDSWFSELFIGNLTSRVTLKHQHWNANGGGGTRSSTLLPITGSRTINSTNTFVIRVTLRDNGTSADDEITITPNNGIMTITEIAN